MVEDGENEAKRLRNTFSTVQFLQLKSLLPPAIICHYNSIPRVRSFVFYYKFIKIPSQLCVLTSSILPPPFPETVLNHIWAWCSYPVVFQLMANRKELPRPVLFPDKTHFYLSSKTHLHLHDSYKTNRRLPCSSASLKPKAPFLFLLFFSFDMFFINKCMNISPYYFPIYPE